MCILSRYVLSQVEYSQLKVMPCFKCVGHELVLTVVMHANAAADSKSITAMSANVQSLAQNSFFFAQNN